MSTVNITIPSLTNGVSQQAASVRSPSQLASQDNAWSSLVDGLIKRAPLEHVAKLRATAPSDAYVHEINRDTTERYVLIFMNGVIEAYNLLTGASISVATPDGVDYITTANPSSIISAVTVADYTFVINKSVEVALGDATDSAVVTITIASPGVVTHTAHGFAADTPIVFSTTGALPTGLTAGTTYWVQNPTTDTYEVSATPGGGSINTSGTQSGVHTATRTVDGIVQSFDKLPSTPVLGDLFKITGSATNPFDNYYVMWNGSVWVETVAPGLYNNYDASTMPHVLVRESDGTFTFKQATWDARLTADQWNSPEGAFVGRTISEVLFHRNRLGLVADESVVFSRAAAFFNFFRSTATQVLDTDPVHTAISHSRVSIIHHAVAFDEQTLLFSDQTQFALTANSVLTPSTSAIGVTTQFECSKLARPVAAGPNLYFAADRGNGSCIREYFVQKDTLTNDASDVTAHCPTYVPGGIFKMAASTSQDCVFALSNTERNTMYVYKFYWRNDEKIQSAWSRWVLPEGDIILSVVTISTVVYLVIQRSDGVYLEKADVQQGLVDADVGLRVHLDRRVLLTGSYDSGTNKTTWTLPYAESDTMQVVLSGDFPSSKGGILTIERPTSSTITAVGDYSGGDAYVGRPFTTRVQLSEPFMRDKSGSPILDGRLQLKRLLVRYANSGAFRVEVTPQARDTFTYVNSGKRLGDASFLIGSPAVSTGSFNVPIMSRSDRVIVELVSDSYLPCSFQSADWVAEYTAKSNRV
jgi:hypothetical protein